MIDVEPVLHEELERLAPEADAAPPDWQDVIRRAQRAPTAPVRTRRRSRLRSAGAFVALACTIAAVALIAPWSKGPSVVDRALAAVGDQPVLHAVIVRPPRPGERVVEIDSGEMIERVERTEIWFDRSRDLKKTVTTLDGRVLDEVLESRAGGFTQSGPIYTCSWIAAHPIEATQAGVSCSASGENGTTPRQIPEQPPTLDTALAGFVDGYRSALATGRAREVARGRVDGREVIWLELAPAKTTAPADAVPPVVPPERVAVDAETFKPLVVEAADGAVRFSVLAIETVAFEQSLFSKPEVIDAVPGGVGGSVGTGSDISPSEATDALGQPALWLGEEWQGYRLIETQRVDLSIGYGPRSDRGPTRTTGVALTYAKLAADGSVERDSMFTLRETTICVTRWGWSHCGPRELGPGTMLAGALVGALIRTEDLYVAVWNFKRLAEPASIELARALRPVPDD